MNAREATAYPLEAVAFLIGAMLLLAFIFLSIIVGGHKDDFY